MDIDIADIDSLIPELKGQGGGEGGGERGREGEGEQKEEREEEGRKGERDSGRQEALACALVTRGPQNLLK